MAGRQVQTPVDQRRRVVITGLGVVAPNGVGKDAFWQSLIAGKSAIDRVTAFDATKYPSQVAAEIRNFEPTDYMAARVAKSVGRFTHLAVAASVLAVRDAKLPDTLGDQDPPVALCFGSSAHGVADIGEENHRRFLSSESAKLDPLGALEFAAHAATSHVGQLLEINGPTTTIASACTTGLDVIDWGAAQIQSGRSEIAIVGASEAPLSEFLFAMFAATGFLSTWRGSPSTASRPYDLLRSGLVLAEGAGALVLEEQSRALDRNAPIYAEIVGHASVSDGGLRGTRSEVYRRGLESAVRAACLDAHIRYPDVDYICAHANGTVDDAAETQAFKNVFQRTAYNTPISSIKSSTGHPMSAAALLQVAAAALSIRDHIIPPTLNLETRDPDCDLDYVPHTARRARVRTVLVHAHSLGGIVPGSHGALILRRPPDNQ